MAFHVHKDLYKQNRFHYILWLSGFVSRENNPAINCRFNEHPGLKINSTVQKIAMLYL